MPKPIKNQGYAPLLSQDPTEWSPEAAATVSLLRKEMQMMRQEMRQEEAVKFYTLDDLSSDPADSRTSGSGTTRTFEMQGAKVGHRAIAAVCKEGASPVGVISASCGQGDVTVRFTADPSTDHSVTILICYK